MRLSQISDDPSGRDELAQPGCMRIQDQIVDGMVDHGMRFSSKADQEEVIRGRAARSGRTARQSGAHVSRTN